MSYQGTGWAWEVRGLNGGERAVLAFIAHRQDQRSNVARASIDEIAAKVEKAPRQVSRILEQLSEPRPGHPNGIVRRIHGGRGRGNISLYELVDFKNHPQKLKSSKGKHDILLPEKVTFISQKDDISDTAIRRERKSKEIQDANKPPRTTSSSENHDDAVSRILEAFEESPVTGSATTTDRITARQLLSDGHTVEQIQYAIALGSARKADSLVKTWQQGHPQSYSEERIKSLKYFIPVIREVEENPNLHSPTYERYLRTVLDKFRNFQRRKPVQPAV